MRNLRASLDGLGVESVRKRPGRIIVEFADGGVWRSAADKIRKVFGLTTAYPVIRTEPDLADLEKVAVCAVDELKFESFAVRTRRANKNFPMTSPEINRHIGSAIQVASAARVDLRNPERTFYIEVLDRDIYFASEQIRCPGGLPAGISGHVVSMFSGGIDSPVASWMMMKRGLKTTFVHFHSMPFTDRASIEKVEDMAEVLGGWHGPLKLALIPFGEIQQKIVTAVPAKYRVVIYRRFMLRIADRVAREVGAGALITGESLGQVASQTLTNLASVEAVSELPLFRPLIGMDKQEIVDLAEKIGTYDLSIEPHSDCCSFLQPPNPVTKTTREELSRVESQLDIDALVQESLSNVEWKVIPD